MCGYHFSSYCSTFIINSFLSFHVVVQSNSASMITSLSKIQPLSTVLLRRCAKNFTIRLSLVNGDSPSLLILDSIEQKLDYRYDEIALGTFLSNIFYVLFRIFPNSVPFWVSCLLRLWSHSLSPLWKLCEWWLPLYVNYRLNSYRLAWQYGVWVNVYICS